MATKICQKEYLKKYLSGDKKKKKKDKKTKAKATVKIIDDDVHVGQELGMDEELLLTGEDAPQIVGVVDAYAETTENKWKSIGVKKEEKSDDDLWGKKASTAGNMDRNQYPIRKKVPRTSDLSPPRKANNLNPARRNSDQSPPRKKSERRSHAVEHNSKHQKRSRWNSEMSATADQSPPRKSSSSRPGRDSDQSPPRRRPADNPKRDSYQSPRRKRSSDRHRGDSDRTKHSHHSPSNRLEKTSGISIKREDSSDQSPPRRRNSNPFKTSIKTENLSPLERGSESPPPTHKASKSSKMSKTLDGKRAGLQDAQTLKIETEERRRNEDKMFNNMASAISGRDAEVQVRKSSSYRRRRDANDEDPEVQSRKAEHEEKKKELYSRWNKGVKQIEAFQAKISDEQYESTKPLARYSNDADLDEMLRQKEREDDPMIAYIRSKKKDKMLEANIPVVPKYKGSYPENRFGIRPGYRWDGVDRSNGYEKKWFDAQSSKAALAEESYKYSVEDL